MSVPGTPWAWGDNYFGQLGNGTNIDSSVPIMVSKLDNIIAIAAGYNNNLALSANGSVQA